MNTNVVALPLRSREPDADADRDAGAHRTVDSLPLLLAVSDAAKLLGISRSAAYRLANAGELPCRRLGGRIYVVTVQLFEMVGAA